MDLVRIEREQKEAAQRAAQLTQRALEAEKKLVEAMKVCTAFANVMCSVRMSGGVR